jgi:hypothetical protein
LTNEQDRRDREDRPGYVSKDPVDAVDELGPRRREASRFVRQPAGVGVGAHSGGLVSAGSRDDETAREHLRTNAFVDRLRLACEQGFIYLETTRQSNNPVSRNLISRAEAHQIIEDDSVDWDSFLSAVANDGGVRGIKHCEVIKSVFRAQFLNDPDEGIDDEYDTEEGVTQLSHGGDCYEERAENEVEPGEDVGSKNLAHRSARSLTAEIVLPHGHASCHLGGAEPGGSCRRYECGVDDLAEWFVGAIDHHVSEWAKVVVDIAWTVERSISRAFVKSEPPCSDTGGCDFSSVPADFFIVTLRTGIPLSNMLSISVV